MNEDVYDCYPFECNGYKIDQNSVTIIDDININCSGSFYLNIKGYIFFNNDKPILKIDDISGTFNGFNNKNINITAGVKGTIEQNKSILALQKTI